MRKLWDRFEFWLFKKLCRRHLELMDQHDHFRMRTSYGWGYVLWSMQPDPATHESYREL